MRRTKIEVMVKGPDAYKEVEEWVGDGATVATELPTHSWRNPA